MNFNSRGDRPSKRRLTTLDELRESVSTYTVRAAEKLRAQRSVCNAVHVLVHTNRFRGNDRKYYGSITIPLTEASSDSRRLVAAALYGLKKIYRSGYQYKKAGIMLREITPATVRQQLLFSEENPKSEKVMKAIDALNGEFGRNTISLASEGIHQRWSAKFETKTPHYTTDWRQIPTAKA